VYHHQTLDGLAEEEMVSRNEEDLVPGVEGQSEVASEDLCRVTPNSKKELS
jgi:hypothetical protein